MTRPPTTIVLNGAWGRVLSGVILAAILAGASGLVVAYRMAWAQQAEATILQDHEVRLRTLEADIGDVKSGVRLLLERTDPSR